MGGWVDDVRMYSNIMTTVSFTTKEDKIVSLLNVLSAKHLRAQLDRHDVQILNGPRSNERSGSLQITFVHNEPDLKRDVIAVPGY